MALPVKYSTAPECQTSNIFVKVVDPVNANEAEYDPVETQEAVVKLWPAVAVPPPTERFNLEPDGAVLAEEPEYILTSNFVFATLASELGPPKAGMFANCPLTKLYKYNFIKLSDAGARDELK